MGKTKKIPKERRKALIVSNVGVMTDKEIQEKFGIPETTFYRLKAEIREDRGGEIITPDLVHTAAEEQLNRLTDVVEYFHSEWMHFKEKLDKLRRQAEEGPGVDPKMVRNLEKKVLRYQKEYAYREGNLTKLLALAGIYRIPRDDDGDGGLMIPITISFPDGMGGPPPLEDPGKKKIREVNIIDRKKKKKEEEQ